MAHGQGTFHVRPNYQFDNLVLPSGRSICITLFSLLIRLVITYFHEYNCDVLHIQITLIYIITPLLTSAHKPVLARGPSSYYKQLISSASQTFVLELEAIEMLLLCKHIVTINKSTPNGYFAMLCGWLRLYHHHQNKMNHFDSPSYEYKEQTELHTGSVYHNKCVFNNNA